MKLELDKIRRDGGTQPRAELLIEVIEDFAEQMRNGAEFPAITVFFDGKDYWLAPNHGIDADGLIELQRLGLVDEDAIAELANGEFRVVARVFDDLLDGPHGDQITSDLVLSTQALAGRNDPEPIYGQKISEDPMVGMPLEAAPPRPFEIGSLCRKPARRSYHGASQSSIVSPGIPA